MFAHFEKEDFSIENKIDCIDDENSNNSETSIGMNNF